MMIQGGGVTFHVNVDIYVDLIVDDLTSLESEYPQVGDLFRAFAKHKQGEANFGFAEIGKDKRLYESLSKTRNGKGLYNRLLKNIPLITVSNNILGDADNTNKVKIFPLRQLNDNPLIILNKLYAAARTNKKEESQGIIDQLDHLNHIISIKPGFFGISLDVSKIFQTWLDRRRDAVAG